VKFTGERAAFDLWTYDFRPICSRRKRKIDREKETFKGSRSFCEADVKASERRYYRACIADERGKISRKIRLRRPGGTRDAVMKFRSCGSAGCAICTVGFTRNREFAIPRSNPITSGMRSGFQRKENAAKACSGKVNTPFPKISGISVEGRAFGQSDVQTRFLRVSHDLLRDSVSLENAVSPNFSSFNALPATFPGNLASLDLSCKCHD